MRVRYYNISPTHFSWTGDRSVDGGATWATDYYHAEAERIPSGAGVRGTGQDAERSSLSPAQPSAGSHAQRCARRSLTIARTYADVSVASRARTSAGATRDRATALRTYSDGS
jgi:hypothetical protein